MIIQIPYEWIEKIFGSKVADNFNTIMLIFFVSGFILYNIVNRIPNNDEWFNKAQKKQAKRIENSLPPLKSEAKSKKKRSCQNQNEQQGYYDTGWTYNEETKLWEPPSSLVKEAGHHKKK